MNDGISFLGDMDYFAFAWAEGHSFQTKSCIGVTLYHVTCLGQVVYQLSDQAVERVSWCSQHSHGPGRCNI